ncbi:MAG TPA: 2'-deoxycytidine 5'-triphosphate deaminase [Thermoleophilaceae bacterium]
MQALPTRPADRHQDDRTGVLPRQELEQAIEQGWIATSEHYKIPAQNVQPASVDLRLGERAWALRCSFLPDRGSTVQERIKDLAWEAIDLVDGATLEPDRPYVIPLVESLRLPKGVRGKANPKSSTGRLDVFTRVITDYNDRFDEIADGYQGGLYLEVVPRSFAVRVERNLSLNQLRLSIGNSRVRDDDLSGIHQQETPLLYMGKNPVPADELTIADGLFLSVDLQGQPNDVVGYRAKKNSRRLDMSKIGRYWWREFWEPVYPERGGRIVLEPEIFYLLLSAEGVCVPPGYAAEMMAYDPTAGELRTHYAGFFDPGFGFDPNGANGTRAALEVRARDVPFMVEHGQAICKLAFERMLDEPDRLYGDAGSHYQGQNNMLSKHFAEQAAGMRPIGEHDPTAGTAPLPSLFDEEP